MDRNGNYMWGETTEGSYFIFNGVRYGEYTEVLFKEEFYKNVEKFDASKLHPRFWGHKEPYFRTFRDIKDVNGKKLWLFGRYLIGKRYYNIVPERDIEKIVTPVYYMTPRELVKKRIKNGSWILYVWMETLVYCFILLVSPLFKQWYLLWTVGLGLYLLIAYKKLSKGGLY